MRTLVISLRLYFTDLTGNSEHDAEVSARSSLSLLKTTANGSHNNLNVLKGTGSNPTSGNSANAFPRVRANSRTNSPNARTARKSLENYNNTQGLAYNTHQNANRELPEGFYEELNTLDPRNNNHFAFPHTGTGTKSNAGVNASSAPMTPAAGNYDQRRQSFPASAARYVLFYLRFMCGRSCCWSHLRVILSYFYFSPGWFWLFCFSVTHCTLLVPSPATRCSVNPANTLATKACTAITAATRVRTTASPIVLTPTPTDVYQVI